MYYWSMTTQSAANHPHKLLQEKKLPGIGAFYPSDLFIDYDCSTHKQILWALLGDELVIVDTYIDAEKTHNEDNYHCIGEGKYIWSQHAIYQTVISDDLSQFLEEHPQYKEKIFPPK